MVFGMVPLVFAIVKVVPLEVVILLLVLVVVRVFVLVLECACVWACWYSG